MTNGLKCGLALTAVLLVSTEAHAVGRTFVASYGTDANASTNCGPTAPCRTFNAALSKTDAAGEVIVLDSAGYGPAPVTITQSVSIIAPDGVYAGITVPAAVDGIDISGSGVSVVLKGLTINSIGSVNNGILITGGPSSLVVADCSIGGFSIGSAIEVNGPIQARIVDTTMRDGYIGVTIAGGATASISHVKLFNMANAGVYAVDVMGGTPAETYASITDSEVNDVGQNAVAFLAYSNSTNTELFVDRAVVTGGTSGVQAISIAGFAYATVTNSLISKTFAGLVTSVTSGQAEITFANSTINANGSGVDNTTGGILNSTGNNLFIGNGGDLSPGSTITVITTR
jgi:hypothetical protein